jgi:hypothetical protein
MIIDGALAIIGGLDGEAATRGASCAITGAARGIIECARAAFMNH